MPLNPSIYDSLKQLTIKAVEEVHTSSGVPLKIAARINIPDRNRASRIDELEPDFWPIIVKVVNRNVAIPLFKTFQNAIESDPVIGPQLNTLVGTYQWLRRIEARDVFNGVLTQQVKKDKEKIVFDEKLFETSCEKLNDFFSSEKLKIEYSAILENFEMEVDTIEFESGLSLHRLSHFEIEKMWNELTWFQEYYPLPIARPSVFPTSVGGIVETYVETPKIIGEIRTPGDFSDLPSAKVTRKLELVLSALRLLKPGTVRFGPVVVRTPFLSTETTSIQPLSQGTGHPFGPKYWLDESEVSDFELIWNIFKKVDLKKYGHLGVGLRRFSLANERSSYEDMLIDASIAFEAFLLSDVGETKEKGELRHRLSVRVAHLLGRDSDEMVTIYKTMKKIYDLRSTVVHGAMLKPNEFEYVDKAIELCRRTTRSLFTIAAEGKQPQWEEWLFK